MGNEMATGCNKKNNSQERCSLKSSRSVILSDDSGVGSEHNGSDSLIEQEQGIYEEATIKRMHYDQSYQLLKDVRVEIESLPIETIINCSRRSRAFFESVYEIHGDVVIPMTRLSDEELTEHCHDQWMELVESSKDSAASPAKKPKMSSVDRDPDFSVEKPKSKRLSNRRSVLKQPELDTQLAEDIPRNQKPKSGKENGQGANRAKKRQASACQGKANISQAETEIVSLDTQSTRVVLDCPVDPVSEKKKSRGRPPLKYSCHDCELSFRLKKELNSHSQIHKEEPYKCSKCSKKFRSAVLLSRHEKSCSKIEAEILSDRVFQESEVPTVSNEEVVESMESNCAIPKAKPKRGRKSKVKAGRKKKSVKKSAAPRSLRVQRSQIEDYDMDTDVECHNVQIEVVDNFHYDWIVGIPDPFTKELSNLVTRIKERKQSLKKSKEIKLPAYEHWTLNTMYNLCHDTENHLDDLDTFRVILGLCKIAANQVQANIEEVPVSHGISKNSELLQLLKSKSMLQKLEQDVMYNIRGFHWEDKSSYTFDTIDSYIDTIEN